MQTSKIRTIKYWINITLIPVMVILFISGLQLHLEDEHNEERFSQRSEVEHHLVRYEDRSQHNENSSEEIGTDNQEGREDHEESGWEAVHQIWALLFIGLMSIHIFLHWNWFKTVIGKLKIRNSKLLALTVLVFVSMVLSAVLMFFHLVPREFEMGEIHFKLGILLIILLIIHIVQRFSWIVSTTRKMAE